MKKINIGYDSPKNNKAEDTLNRWSFAEEVYSLIKNTPKEWSVRIGIYGGWGGGKTTVLRFLNTIANKDKQVVIWLNTWEYQNNDQLWEEFVLCTYRALKKFKVPLKVYKYIQLYIIIVLKRLLRKLVLPLQPLSKLNPYSEAGIGVLKSFLQFNKKIMYDLPRFIKDKKVIVIIDDLDRTNPFIIPQMLFGIKELLDLKGLVFVAAFDPEVINETLIANNIIIGKEKDYLEKIIDFPKWLPEPEEATFKTYLRNELKDSISFIEYDSVVQLYGYLKKNPRKIKQFIRSLVVFKDEIIRYNKDEINIPLLLLITILNTYYPKYYNQIIGATQLWDSFEVNNWFGPGKNNESESLVEKNINEFFGGIKIPANDRNSIKNIIKHIASIVNFNLTLTIKSHANITQSKSVMTWKEYYKFINDFELNETLSFLGTKIKSLNVSNDIFIKELFTKTIRYREWSLEQASDSNLINELDGHVKDANLALHLIKLISFDFNGFVGQNPILTINDFSDLYKMISRWLHFIMPDIYTEVRKQEKEFLNELAEKITIDPKTIMEYLKPWFPFRTGAYDSQAEKELAEKLGLILEKRISHNLINKFMEEGWIYSILNRDENICEHYILLRKNSYLWSSELKQRFYDFIKDKEHKSILTLNSIYFISLIDELSFDPMGNWSVINDNNILNDNEIMLHIWQLAMQQIINPRMFRSVEKFRDKVKGKTNLELPKPEWWDEIKKMVDGRNKT